MYEISQKDRLLQKIRRSDMRVRLFWVVMVIVFFLLTVYLMRLGSKPPATKMMCWNEETKSYTDMCPLPTKQKPSSPDQSPGDKSKKADAVYTLPEVPTPARIDHRKLEAMKAVLEPVLLSKTPPPKQQADASYSPREVPKPKPLAWDKLREVAELLEPILNPQVEHKTVDASYSPREVPEPKPLAWKNVQEIADLLNPILRQQVVQNRENAKYTPPEKIHPKPLKMERIEKIGRVINPILRRQAAQIRGESDLVVNSNVKRRAPAGRAPNTGGGVPVSELTSPEFQAVEGVEERLRNLEALLAKLKTDNPVKLLSVKKTDDSANKVDDEILRLI